MEEYDQQMIMIIHELYQIYIGEKPFSLIPTEKLRQTEVEKSSVFFCRNTVRIPLP